jgi:hypothetical protein
MLFQQLCMTNERFSIPKTVDLLLRFLLLAKLCMFENMDSCDF